MRVKGFTRAILVCLCVSLNTALACDIPEGWLQMESDAAAQHTLWLNPDETAYQQGQPFGADILVCSEDDQSTVELISIDALMPAHKHGMNYRPSVAATTQRNSFRADGLFFHMPGQWQVTVTLGEPDKRERHTLTLKVQ